MADTLTCSFVYIYICVYISVKYLPVYMCITLHQYKVFLNLFRNTEDLEIPLFDKLIYRYRYHPCYRDKLLVHAQSHRYCPHLFVLLLPTSIPCTPRPSLLRPFYFIFCMLLLHLFPFLPTSFPRTLSSALPRPFYFFLHALPPPVSPAISLSSFSSLFCLHPCPVPCVLQSQGRFFFVACSSSSCSLFCLLLLLLVLPLKVLLTLASYVLLFVPAKVLQRYSDKVLERYYRKLLRQCISKILRPGIKTW